MSQDQQLQRMIAQTQQQQQLQVNNNYCIFMKIEILKLCISRDPVYLQS